MPLVIRVSPHPALVRARSNCSAQTEHSASAWAWVSSAAQPFVGMAWPFELACTCVGQCTCGALEQAELEWTAAAVVPAWTVQACQASSDFASSGRTS